MWLCHFDELYFELFLRKTIDQLGLHWSIKKNEDLNYSQILKIILKLIDDFIRLPSLPFAKQWNNLFDL